MKIYEFSIVHRHAIKPERDVKVRFNNEDVKAICAQALDWLTLNLKSKVQYQWEMPVEKHVMTGIQMSGTATDGQGIISNSIPGLIVKVRRVLKAGKA